jgi:sterol desaturase/sphingolipid hydroxylase (fatty acid hydroxylase superfamily)
MTPQSSLLGIGYLLAAMAGLTLLEALIPLRARGVWNRRHLVPNLTLTLITLALSLVLNIAILLGLVWLQARGWGLFNALSVQPLIALAGAVLILELAWYATHVSLHKAPVLWRIHAIHHSDLAVDVTTTLRQHPAEGLVRYVYLAVFAFTAGVSPAAFAVYRVWSALHGFFEHANIRLPAWLDTAISLVFVSPNMHKIHHARDQALTDHNYGNILSIWDRLFGSFIPARQGREVDYGLAGYDRMDQQTTAGLLALPFQPSGGPTQAAARIV